MKEPLVASKFLIPECKPHYIDRLHVLRKLRQGENRKLILISAPPGFGKTTLLAEWMPRLSIPHAWLTLEENDDHPQRFFQYFIGAIQKVMPGFCEAESQALNALPQPPLASLTTAISNGLAALQEPLLIVLDDFHFINDPDIHKGMVFLVEHLTPQVHICIATRADPPWKIARLRTEQDVLEIRAGDLRFDPDEAARFMETSIEGGIQREDLRLLLDRTEGWVAALQLVAGSLQGNKDVHAFIRSFAGSDRSIGDYLVEEVLNRQTPTRRDFMIQTSILDLLNENLCNALLSRSDGREMLAALDMGNLFLLPIDEQRKWYRFHPLFRDLLLNHLGQYPTEQVRELHRNASGWFLAHDDPLNSLKHALKADDLGIAASIAEQHTLSFLDHGRISEVASWLDTLPNELISNWPWLLISRAWVDLYLANHGKLDFTLRLAEEKLDLLKNPAVKARIRGHIHAIKAYSGDLLGKPEDVLLHATRALELLPPNDGVGRCHAYMALGNYFYQVNDPEKSVKSFQQGVACAEGSENELLRVLALCFLANIYSISRSDPNKAETICQKLLEEYPTPEARRSLPALAFALTTLSQLLLNRGDFAASQSFCEEAVSLSRYWQHTDTLRFSLIVLSNILLCRNDIERARQMYHEANRFPQTTSIWYSPSTLLLELQFLLQTEEFVKVQSWADSHQFDFSDVRLHGDYYILYLRFLIKIREYKKAVLFAQKLIDLFTELGLLYNVASLLGDLACAYYGMGDTSRALENISKMVGFGQIERAAVPIFRKGPLMMDLLRLALSKGVYAVEVKKLLDEIHRLFPQEIRVHTAGGGLYLADHLTEREVEILKLLDSGRSSTELAQELVVAVSTIRTHMKNIYNKLGVSHRIEALRKARELRII